VFISISVFDPTHTHPKPTMPPSTSPAAASARARAQELQQMLAAARIEKRVATLQVNSLLRAHDQTKERLGEVKLELANLLRVASEKLEQALSLIAIIGWDAKLITLQSWIIRKKEALIEKLLEDIAGLDGAE
jgi:hypothetical protein